MKKHLSLLSLVLGLVLFFSCTDDDSQVGNVQRGNMSSFLVSLDSAIAMSNQAIRAISETNETRSSQSERQASSVKLVNLASNVATRSQSGKEISSSLYFINYKGNKGFAIVSSDNRLRPLYAISDTGNIVISDTIVNKNLAFFFHGVERDIVCQSARTPQLDSVGGKVSVTLPQVRPMIWKAPRLWGQDVPYNTYCFTKDGKKAQVGCIAVACGIIMTYYSWPTFIDGVHIGWHGFKKYTFDHDVDYVFGKLGEPKQLDMDYGEEGSGASITNVYRTFERMGYSKPDKLKKFSEDAICNLFEKYTRKGYGPILVYGENVKTGGAHAWVVDGYCKNLSNLENINYETDLFHCIWGWKGQNNGYFYLNNGCMGGLVKIVDGYDKGTTATNMYSNLSYIATFVKDNNRGNVKLQ